MFSLLPDQIPGYAIRPVIGLTANGIIFLLCLIVWLVFPRYRLVKNLLFFCLSISVYFLGFSLYAFQLSEESILFWYRIMLLGLVWMPVTWIYFANALREKSSGNVAQAAVGVSLAFTIILVFSDSVAVLGLPLEKFPLGGVLRPQSWLVRPLILVYSLSVALGSAVLIMTSWWPGPERPPFVRPFLIGLIFWSLGGLHDAALMMRLPMYPPWTALWLASFWLTLCLTLAATMHFRTLEEALARRTGALIHARNLAALGSTAARVAHEVGGFLNKVVFALAVVRADRLGPEAEETLAGLEQGAIKLAEFSRRFLTAARKPRLDFEPVSAREALQTVIDDHKDRLTEQGVQVSLEAAGDVLLSGDWSMLNLAFSNVIANSLEAMPDGGNIHIRVGRPDGELAAVEFVDDGPGMEIDDQEATFKPFLAGPKGSTGLGLPLIASIVEAHGGRVRLTSTPGEGTKVVMMLPVDPGKSPGME